MLKIFGKKLFNAIPESTPLLLKAAQFYIDRSNGDNDSNPSTNGEERFLSKYLQNIKDGIVFDVGANVGNYSIYCLGVNPTLEIHLFEPASYALNQLQHRGLPGNIKINDFGLGERQEILQLNIVDTNSGMNSIYQRHGLAIWKANSVELINIQTIDEYCLNQQVNYIDLLKVDVEGHELAVFKGAQKMLSQKRIRCIQFEYGGCNLDARVYLLDIWNFLSNFGFEFYKIYPEDLLLIQAYEKRLETFRYSNFIAMS